VKRVHAFLLLAAVLVGGNLGYCGTIDPPYEVGTWRGFRKGAVSYTFDDNCSNQYAIAIPMFNSFDFDMTLFTVTGWSPNWTTLQNAANQGHEIASHTVTHPHLQELNITEQTTELENSQSAIDSHITGDQCITIAYPYCEPSDPVTLTETYYIAARICSNEIVPSTLWNFYWISSFNCGSLGPINSTAQFISKFTTIESSHGWCVFMIHGIDDDGGYSPLSSTILEESLEYLDANRETLWVSTFSNVVRYMKERMDVSVTEISNTGETITASVTDTLDNAIYNYPVTIRRPVPEGWGSADVNQNGSPVTSSIVLVNSIAYVMFDAVPDGGNVVISKGTYGDVVSNGIVDVNDLDFFFDFWLVEDCNIIDWLDLDEDCAFDFYEFSVMADNWQ
jgi:hypothetical protein